MCEMLVRVVDKVNRDDPYLDAQCTKRGDVIAICQDGWPWSGAELKNPDWRVIKIPKVSVLEAQAFLQPELDADPKNPSRVLQRRAFKVDLENAELLPVKTVLDDAARKTETALVDFTFEQLQAVKVEKPRLQDPNVFELPAEKL